MESNAVFLRLRAFAIAVGVTDMPVVLQEIEQRLRSHFKQLSAEKQKVEQPTFALEHCLEPEDVHAMREHLYASLPRLGMNSQFKHCWIVHAAEHGYTFQGLEFWQSFGELTKNWRYYGDRSRLRDWYAEFADSYHGVRPVGRWGSHFSYISWPITHALLPNDLQVQLAHTLYNIRYRLDELMLLDPESVGRMVAKQADCPSSRFKLFLEQHDLVGRVVRALLEGDLDETVIYRPTLLRITTDLNTKNNARAWLKDARRYYDKFRTQFSASTPRFQLNPTPAASEETQIRSKMNARGVLLRPRLRLQQKAINQWEAFLLVPPLHPLVNVKPQFKDHLAKVRFRVPAHGPALYLGLSLLSGRPVPRRLVHWPQERQPLLEFTIAEHPFDVIVNTECQLLPATIWVFLCTPDGSAVHVMGQHVRPGQIYIVAARDPKSLVGLGNPVVLDCEGVAAVCLKVPAVVDTTLNKVLQEVGIALHNKVRIEPVGLQPRQWTDDGVGEWLSTETPLFALTCDQACDGYQIELSGSDSQFLPGSREVGSTLIALRDLAIGCHQVKILALQFTDGPLGPHRKSIASADMTVYVRHPTTWSPHARLPSAMVIDTNPSVPSLDDFLRGRLELQVEGDESRNAVCNVILIDSVSERENVIEILQHRLPVTRNRWSDALVEFLKDNDELQFSSSHSAYISVQAEDLGECRIPLHHEPQPLRWAIRYGKPGAALFLINEGISGPISITRHPFEHPLHPQPIDEATVTQGTEITSNDGLYVASQGANVIGIVVAAKTSTHGLASLGAAVDYGELETFADLKVLIENYALWSTAKPSNYRAELKQHSASHAILRRIYSYVCGPQWVRLEDDVNAHTSDPSCWEQLENAVHNRASFAISLSKAWRERGSAEGFDAAGCFFELGRSYGISTGHEELQIAWSLATNPVELSSAIITIDSLHTTVSVLLRGARLLWLSQELRREPH